MATTSRRSTASRPQSGEPSGGRLAGDRRPAAADPLPRRGVGVDGAHGDERSRLRAADRLRAWLMPQVQGSAGLTLAEFVQGQPGSQPDISILKSEERIPWSGHTTRYAMSDVYQTIGQHKMVLIFVNTRSQAELTFQGLWAINEDNLPIALHHGYESEATTKAAAVAVEETRNLRLLIFIAVIIIFP